MELKNNTEFNELSCEIIEFFKKNSSICDDKEISSHSKLKEDLNLDSLDFVELVMQLEDKYSIKIEDEAANKLQTIGDVACLIIELKSKTNS